jgi:hypothetical protein
MVAVQNLKGEISQLDGQGDSYIPSQTLFAGGIITLFMNGKLQYEINLINHV